MARHDVDDANQLVSDLIGLLISAGALIEEGDSGAALALIGHGLRAAGNPVYEWESVEPVCPDNDLPLFAHFRDGEPIPWQEWADKAQSTAQGG